MAVTLVFLIFASFAILYLYLTRNYKYWQKRGVPFPEDIVPGIGNVWEFVTMKTTFSNYCRNIYNKYKGCSMVGFYNLTTPTLMVLEPELVKTVLQTNFASFHENTLKVDPSLDPLLANNPFFTYGEKWAIGRKRLTYAFSSMRLKILLESVKQVCVKFDDYLNRKLNKVPKIEIELKDLFSKFTAQVVSSAGFGVDGLCFDDERQSESFYTLGKSFLEPSFLNNIIFNIVFFFPSLSKILRARFLPKKADHFFRTLVTEVMEQRRTDSVRRNDFLQLMVELERMEGDKFDLGVLASHAVSFFIDGYETSSNVLSFVGFQLATHPEIQKRLREEVLSVFSRHNGEITYEGLKEMTYMDQVISESQRIIPTLGFQTKTCTEDIELKGSDGLVCRVQRGTQVLISVHGLQEDNRYWENPEVYDPDRFNPDRKHKIEKFTFLPFGEGPRICPGQRMAQLQMKACLATLLRKYSLELSPKTQVPLKMISSSFLNLAVGGLWAFIQPI